MKEVISSALKIGAKCFVFSERFSTFVAPIFIALRVSQSDMATHMATATDNRMAALGGPSSATTYSYDATGNLTGYAYPNTVQTAKLFDPLNRLTQTCSATSSPACSAGTKLSSFAYTLGLAGNRTAAAELPSGRNVAYRYDADYVLTSETITSDPNSGSESYTYDVVGNRKTLSSTVPALPGNQTFSYDPNDRLTTDGYNANGNTTSSGRGLEHLRLREPDDGARHDHDGL